MKLIFLSSIFLNFVLCDEAADSSEFDVEERRFKGIVKLVYNQITTSMDKGEIFSKIQNYGCHCFPGQSREVGSLGSKFVDDQDELCMKLASCHRCVELEYGHVEDFDADNSGFSTDLDPVAKTITCTNNPLSNKDEEKAKYALCQCDKYFAEELGKIWDDSKFNQFFWVAPKQVKKYPDVVRFDPTDANFCKQRGSSQGDGNINECCGSYPNVKPYNSQKKGCCGGSITNLLMETCCNDDIIMLGDTCL